MMANQDEQSRLPIGLIMVFTIAAMIILNTFSTLHRSSRRSRALNESNIVDAGVKSIGDSCKRIEEKIVYNEHEQDDRGETNGEGSLHMPVRATTGVIAVSDNNNWRCACEGSFLPPGLLKTFSRAENIYKMGVGDCYHKM